MYMVEWNQSDGNWHVDDMDHLMMENARSFVIGAIDALRYVPVGYFKTREECHKWIEELQDLKKKACR